MRMETALTPIAAELRGAWKGIAELMADCSYLEEVALTLVLSAYGKPSVSVKLPAGASTFGPITSKVQSLKMSCPIITP